MKIASRALPDNRDDTIGADSSLSDIVPPARTRLLLQLLLLVLAVGSGGYARTVLSPVQEAMAAALALSDNSVALLQGLALAIPVVLLGAPIGMVVDRLNRAMVLLLLLVICAAGTVLSGLAPNYGVLFVSRMIVGIGIAGALPAGLSIAADLFSPDVRGRINMALGFGQVVGAAMAFTLGGGLLEALKGAGPLSGWRGAVAAMALPLVLVAVAALFIREPERQEAKATKDMPVGQSLRDLAKYAFIVAPLIFGSLIVSMADSAAGIWAAPILERRYHLSPAEIGPLMGGVILSGGVIGVVIGGVMADIGQRKAGDRGVLLVATTAAVFSLPCSFFPLMPNVVSFAGMLIGLLVCGSATGISTTTLFTLVIPNELRGFSIGLVLSGGMIVSIGVAPSIVSLLSSTLGGPAQLPSAMTCVAVVGSLMGVISFVIAMSALSRHKQIDA